MVHSVPGRQGNDDRGRRRFPRLERAVEREGKPRTDREIQCAGADRITYPEFSGLREVAQRTECTGGGGGKCRGGAASGEPCISPGPAREAVRGRKSFLAARGQSEIYGQIIDTRG